MPVITAIVAGAVIATSTCVWDNPGSNRYTGNVPAAVHNYTDIPIEIRNRLQARMEKHKYDEIVVITPAGITGKDIYVDLRDMHFGANKLCRNVSYDKWAPRAKESALVYCEDKHCLIVPAICGNVSRVTKVIPSPMPEKEKKEKGIPDKSTDKSTPEILQDIPKSQKAPDAMTRGTNTVPEPGSFILTLTAIIGLAVSKRLRK